MVGWGRRVLVGSLVWALPWSGAAQSRPYSIAVDPCVGVDTAEVQRIVDLERSRAPASDQVPVVRVHVGCDAGLTVIRLRQPDSGWSLERKFELADPGRGRARYVALEIAELSAVGFGHPAPPPRRIDDKNKSSRVGRLLLAVQGVAQFRGNPLFGSGGGGLEVAFYGLRWWGWMLDAGLAHGRAEVEAGQVSATSLGLSLASFVDPVDGPLSLRLGAGVRAENIWLKGLPSNPSQTAGREHHGATWGPLVRVQIAYPWFKSFVIGAGLEGGWTARPIHGLGGEQGVAKVEGPWLRATLSLGAQFLE